MTTERQAVATRTAAKVGDWIWLFNRNACRYVDGKYDGRGVWRLVQVTGLTNYSVIVREGRFETTTGRRRGSRINPFEWIYGQAERQAFEES